MARKKKTGLKTEIDQNASASVPAFDSKGESDVLSNIESHILELVDKYINALDDPEEIKENNGLFVDMIKYIYKYYVSALLGNDSVSTQNRYDYKVLNELFNIYTNLVYKYKKNKRPLITEYCLFTHVSESTLNDIRMGNINKATDTDIASVKRWYSECKNALTNGNNVFEIFLLKACYGLNDNLASIPLEAQGITLTPQMLPDLSKSDNKTPPAITEKP